MFIKDINLLHVPKGIRLISWATAIRFAGWGFVEMFIPIFLLSFAHSYAETGLLKSVYDIVFLLALPVVSRLADKVSSKKIILSGLVLYPLIALGYYFAGVYGAVIFIVLARMINGVSYALDSVGKRTYMRRYTDHEHIGLIFGYFDTLSNFWWLAAAALGLILLQFFSIHVLFLLIIPTTLIAMVLIALIPHERTSRAKNRYAGKKLWGIFQEIYSDYKLLFRFIARWNLEQKYNAILYSLLNVIFIVISFFLPLVIYETDHSYSIVFLVTAFSILPMVFGVPLGFLADKASTKTVGRMICMAICLLALLPFISSLVLLLSLVFVIGLSVYYAMLVLERSATLHESRSHMGSLSGAFYTVAEISQILPPIILGFFIDKVSLLFAILVVCLIGFAMVVPLYLFKIDILATK